MFRLIKKSYHQFSLNNLMKIESLEFKLYFDVVVFWPALLNLFPMQGFHR